MGRHRQYANSTERQRAHRAKVRAEALQSAPQVQGEGYTLYQGDALALVPLLGPFDHCITDPPYEQEAHTLRRSRAMLAGRARRHTPGFAPITAPQRQLLGQLRCQWILIFCQAEAIALYQAVLGPKYRRPLLWVKPDSTPQFSGDRPAMGYESIVCAWGQPGRSQWNGGGKRGVYAYAIHDSEARLHSTQKPLPLMAALIRDFTQPGDLVLDPFMGSGTTGVACLHEQRRFVGIERDPATFALACDRIAAAARQGALFPARAPAPQQLAL